VFYASPEVWPVSWCGVAAFGLTAVEAVRYVVRPPLVWCCDVRPVSWCAGAVCGPPAGVMLRCSVWPPLRRCRITIECEKDWLFHDLHKFHNDLVAMPTENRTFY